ncbi:unnamed protein product [Paramecium sonneborni]|uniref:Uncharacterized protein n=1 Tax=Paramecium sonneborni TaxID=65129 RepID=A0A8S1N8P7_9CILI|nr:unnamed protein product [Paramecium sonneborni]
MKNNSNQELRSDNQFWRNSCLIDIFYIIRIQPQFLRRQAEFYTNSNSISKKMYFNFQSIQNITINELDAVIIEKFILHTYHKPKLSDIQKTRSKYDKSKRRQAQGRAKPKWKRSLFQLSIRSFVSILQSQQVESHSRFGKGKNIQFYYLKDRLHNSQKKINKI